MEEQKKSRGERFVEGILAFSARDKGFAAKMSRSDNPDTEYLALGALCSLGVNVENDAERMPFAFVGAAICRGRLAKDGGLPLGVALRKYYDDRKTDGSSWEDNPRLRRLLACDRIQEVCLVLRQIFSLLQAKSINVCYARVLDDLLSFRFDNQRQRIKRHWASDFYATPNKASSD